MKSSKLPMNIQFFAEPGQDPSGQEPSAPPQAPAGSTQGSAAAPQIDYDKIQKMLEGTLSAKEDVALKSYFKQQGLSQEEAEQAMAAFKAEKAKNTPDAAALQNQLMQEKALNQKAQVENVAMLAAMSLGLDAKTIPYVLKMADLSNAIGQDGKINEETVKNAINKVLEDIPQLKPAEVGNKGFQIGAGGGGNQNTASEDALKAAFGITS